MSEETYVKDARKSTFIVGWAPYLVVYTLIFFCGYIALSYLLFRFLPVHPIWALAAALVLNYFEMRKTYRLIKEKSFASISDDKLVLNFGKDSFLWDNIQSVSLGGERWLTVEFEDNKKRGKRMNDLTWLSRKKDFINNLKNSCIERSIPYKQSELTLFSQTKLFFLDLLLPRV